MSDTQPRLSLDDQRRLLARLSQLVTERVRDESSMRASFDAREAAHREEIDTEHRRLTSQFQVERDDLQSQYTNSLTRVIRGYESTIESALREHDKSFRETKANAERNIEQTQSEWSATVARLSADQESQVRDLHRWVHEFKDKIEQQRLELRTLETVAKRTLRKRRCERKTDDIEAPTGICDTSNPLESFSTSLAAARESLRSLASHALPKFLFTLVLLTLPVLIITVGMLLLGLFPEYAPQYAGGAGGTNESAIAANYFWGAGIGAVALGLIAVLFVILRPIIVAHTRQAYSEFRQQIANADIALYAAVKLRAAEGDTRRGIVQVEREQKQRTLEIEFQKRLAAIGVERETRLKATADQLQDERKSAAESRDSRQATINEQFSQRSQQARSEQELQLKQLFQREQSESDAIHEMRDRSWNRLVMHWKNGVADVEQALNAMWAFCRERFPDWDTTDWEKWQPTEASLPVLQFGSYGFSLNMLEGGVPENPELRPSQTHFALPAVMSFADRPALLLEAWGEGRVVASRAMQTAMLRLMTSLPPGKVRFTIIDPVGLGQNFSAFMHLADFDEKFVNHRIWTEPNHINQRLSDLTEHMEDVIQTYLRNEFQTIDEYNRQAGEVAEPFQVLVVANFPAGFTDEAAQRLLSIVTSGSRCGVYTLISTDSKLDWPRNFDVADLESHSATLQWNGRCFSWRDEDLKDLPLALDEPPADERLTHIIRIIGRKAKDAIRVEVPFSTVTVPPERWWTHDSRGSIDIALGRAGASKLQYLRLGKGTSQHVLISGKTGSGKSTLLHALITNTAIHYSPDEVEFYLIDFKKGVEFKPYASRRLPHARIVAIESEREFGMSVLERLDQELRVRGDLFRQAGVQDIRNFRDANPSARMPRVLLIIDEFQEFFTQDDKVAQEAALLLDRLVRQGRAFGIHVLLGSQTLAGAYSLARSTIGQMAVRIALQCSEADSHLILSEDNTAARLLSRPGEAIYNDANGLFEGNHPFQVVWLSAGEQEDYLSQLAMRASQRERAAPPLIVFEGNAPADPAENPLLRQMATEGESAGLNATPRAWLGDAVAIKDPTAVTFRRQSGANLLIVGQQEEMALGMLATALMSIGAAGSIGNGSSARIVLLDGTRPDSPEFGWWRRFAAQMPLNITFGAPQDAARLVGELAAEVARRVDAGGDSEQPLYLCIYNVARFRDLRRSDDDFSFSSMGDDKPANAAKQLVSVLRDGPTVGVHTLLWCDTHNTVNRWMERSTLRELDQRVLMQMSANDSSNLMDGPEASRLGQNRAILYSEELGQQEKFRPYGIPSAEWLVWFASQLTARAANAAVT